MNSEFIKVDLLGKLYIDELYLFYDDPQLFTCISRFGQKYMGLYIDVNEVNQKWLFAPISEARLAMVKSNRISLRHVFVEPEDDFIWLIEKEYESDTAKASKIYPPDLNGDVLPAEDTYLDWKYDKMLSTIDDEIVEISKKERRDIIDLSLEVSDSHCREIGCEVLGEVLTNTQQLLYSLAYKSDNIRGQIPKFIKDRNTLIVTGTFAASFGVRFKSYDLCDLLGETSVTPTIRLLTNLMGTKNDEKKLKEFLNSQSRRAILKYRSLMRTLMQADMGLKMKVASPNNYYFNVKYSMKEIADNLAFLESEINNMVSNEVLYGEIVGINVEKKTFAFKSIDGEHITGKLSNDFVGTVFEVPKQVEITVEQRVNINDITKEEKYTYTLLKIDEIMPNS